MDFNKLFQSKKFKVALCVLGALVILLLTFKAGMFVGYKKAGFSGRWAENYHRNFGGPKRGFMNEFMDRDFMSGHGTAGTIAKIDNGTIIIAGRDGVEKVINVINGTIIRKEKTNATLADLKANDSVVVIGSPNANGSIDAKIIRVFDAQNYSGTASSTPSGFFHPMFHNSY